MERFFENEELIRRNMIVGLFDGSICIVKMRVSWLMETEGRDEDSL